MTDQTSSVPQPRPAPPPSAGATHPLSMSTATRHLVAGAYLDERFCRAALEEVYDQPRRAVAPSYGFDLGTVLAHCRRASSILLVRDAVIVGVFLLSLCVTGLIGIVVGGVLLAGTQSAVSTARLFRETLHRLTAGEPPRPYQIIRTAVTGTVGFAVASTCLLLLTTLVGGLAVSQFVEGGADSAVSDVAGMLIGTFMVTVLAGFGPPVTARVLRWHHAVQHGPAGRPAAPVLDARIEEIRRQQGGNTIVYSGYSPFVGSGPVLGTTNMALRMIRESEGFDDRTAEAQREYEQLPFVAEQLVGYVRDRLAPLGRASDPEHRLPGLTVTDHVFTVGTETTELALSTDGPTMMGIIRQPLDARRHYLACQVTSWKGELVTSVYVHFALQGRTLYLETATCALAPCRDEYRVVDDVRSLGPVPYLRAAWTGLAESPRVVAQAPVNLIRAGIRWVVRRVQDNHGVLPYGVDRGARVGVRELATLDEVRNDFQQQDVAKYREIITRRVVAATLDFLVTNGVDVTEFRQRANVLINSGVYAGGNIGAIGDIKDSFNPSTK
ncbi:hypothetical protein [Micromonospora halophytica]|uniref:Uncharacterized protein n=1 Tax=Micromonospora halophytica TaxID=47864 RepID=A0A1C5HZF3_9ACTN|nr:hypothetical protein [Micromonospora halophytica]SCG51001.1 hypothetical protein GA0070560_106259 [Micromonospora halophytica]